MSSTLIEKIKGFLYLGGEKEDKFGIIKVYPYLCQGNLEKTKERAIYESHHLRKYTYKIYVRSKEAVLDITKALDRHDFPYQVKNGREQVLRQWFSTESDLLKYLVYDEASILVRIKEENLETFMEMVEKLGKDLSYRNIYQGEDEVFYIV